VKRPASSQEADRTCWREMSTALLWMLYSRYEDAHACEELMRPV
jgi:hypothetical protein